MNRENLQYVIASVQSKVEKLVYSHRKLKDENLKLGEENKKLIEKVQSQHAVLKELEDKNKALKLSKIITQNNDHTPADKQDKNEVRQKINELVREIDKCMALLNK